jgi:hypothetical protein
MVRYYHEPAKFIVETNIQILQNRLQKGQILEGKIVYRIENNLYLLRILGQNLIMKSKLNFSRLDKVKVKVKKLEPKLELVLLRGVPNLDNSTDIKV